MSSGKVHTKASLILASGFLVGTLFTKDPADLQYALGALVGVVITPDCDVDAGFSTNAYLRRVGWWAESSWNSVWWMYKRSLKHGGELSHFPVISTLGRLAYLFLFVIILPYLFLKWIFPSLDLLHEFAWWFILLITHWKIVLGLIAADTIHWCLDIATSGDRFDLNSLVHFRTRGLRKRQIRGKIQSRRPQSKGTLNRP